MVMKFVRATKYNSFLKLGLAGPPGSGKTFSALNIAKHLSEKRIALIDSELGAASKYAGENGFDFDVLELLAPDDNGKEIDKPFTPQRYMEAIKAAYDSGLYDVLIIDGISEEWADAGGILQYVDQITRNNDTRSAWKQATPLHKKFINYILRVRLHVICTMQAKKEMVASKDADGRVTGKKVTLEPIQREDIARVYDVFGLLQDKDMIIDKTRCRQLDGQVFHKPGKEVADILKEWLKGDPMPERPEYEPDLSQASQKVNSDGKSQMSNSSSEYQQAVSQPSGGQGEAINKDENVKKLRAFLSRAQALQLCTDGDGLMKHIRTFLVREGATSANLTADELLRVELDLASREQVASQAA